VIERKFLLWIEHAMKQPIVDVSSHELPAECELAVSERADFFESRDRALPER
jgi:hypothetical protein